MAEEILNSPPVPSPEFLGASPDDAPPSIEDMYSKELQQTLIDVEETEEEERNAPISPFGEEVMDQKYVDDVARGYSETEFSEPQEQFIKPYEGEYTPHTPLFGAMGEIKDQRYTESKQEWGDYFDEDEGVHWGALRMGGDAWIGLLASGAYSTDAFVQNFINAANYASDDPNVDIRFFSILGDLMMQHGGPAKDAGRDLGRFVLPWMVAFKTVKAVVAPLKESPRFISTLKGMLESKKHRLGQFIGGDVPAAAVAQFGVGSMAYKPTERGVGGSMLEVIDKWVSETTGTPYVANYIENKDPSKDRDLLLQLYSGLGEAFLQIGLDKFIIPTIKSMGLAAWQAKPYGLEALKKRFVSFIALEKHALVGDSKATVNANTKSGNFVVINQAGKLTMVPRGDGKMELYKGGQLVPKDSPVVKVTAEGEPMQTTFGMKLPASPDEGLQAMYTMFKDGSLAKTMTEARTFDEKMALIQDLTTVLNSASGMAGKGGKKTFQQMLKESDAVLDDLWGWDKSGLLARQAGSPINEPILIAYSRAASSAQDELFLAIQSLGKATESSKRDSFNEFFRTLRNFSGISTQFADVLGTAGRTLGAARWAKRNFDDILDSPELAKVMALEEGASMNDVMRLAAVMNAAYLTQGKKGLSKAINEFGKSGYTEAFYEGWIGLGLLSNPALHHLNLIVGMANVGTQIGSRQYAALASRSAGYGDVHTGEAMAGAVGMLGGIITAFRAATKAFVTGDTMPAFSGMKLEHWVGTKNMTANNLGIPANSVAGLAIDGLGKAARLNNRMLLSEDELVKVFSYEVERYMLSYRKAMLSMKEGGHKWNYEKFQTFFKEIAENPRTHMVDGVSIHQRGIEMGKLNTFQQQLGRIGKLMQNAQSNTPLLSPMLKLFVPFVKVLSNIPKYTAQHTPLSALNITGERSPIRSRFAPNIMPKSRQMEEVGRMGFGSMIMVLGGVMYLNGMLTPHSEFRYRDTWKKEKQKKQVGQPSMSVRHIDDQGGKWWADIQRLQPYSEWLGWGAELVKFSQNNDDKSVADRWIQLLHAGKSTFVNTTWMPNLEKALEPLSDQTEPHKFKQMMYSLQAPMTPAVLRSARKADPRGGNIPTEYRGFSLNLKDQLKGIPADMSMLAMKWKSSLTARHILGERDWRGRKYTTHDTAEAAKKGITPFYLPPAVTTGMFSFMPVHKDKGDRLDQEVDDLNLIFDKPSDKVDTPVEGKSVRMMPWEYDYFKFLIGHMKNPVSGKTLESAMYTMMDSDGYKKAPKEQAGDFPMDRMQLLKKVYNGYVKRAKNWVVQNSDIKARIQSGESGEMPFTDLPNRSSRGRVQ